MSPQTALTESPPIILDATCSYGRIWPAHASIRIDNRPETHPDIVMDNTDLKFQDAYFDEIYYDPPHVISHNSPDVWARGIKKLNANRRLHAMTPGFFERYGVWPNRQAWFKNVEGVNREFYRCLKPTGRIRIKISDSGDNMTVHLSELLDKLSNFILEKQRMTKSRGSKGKSVVYWLTLKPKPCQK